MWNEKADEIASCIIERMTQPYSKEAVLSGLRAAARKGMEWECDNWIKTRKK